MLRHRPDPAQARARLGGPLLGATINVTAALIATTAFVAARVTSARCAAATERYFIGGGIAENGGVSSVLALGFGDVSVVIPLAGTRRLVLGLATDPSERSKLGWRIVAGVALA